MCSEGFEKEKTVPQMKDGPGRKNMEKRKGGILLWDDLE